MSRMPKIYQEFGGPLRWQDDVTGVLPAAVRAYINEGPGRTACMPWQVELLRDLYGVLHQCPMLAHRGHGARIR